MELIDKDKLLCALCKWDISRLYLVESFRELIEEQPMCVIWEDVSDEQHQ